VTYFTPLTASAPCVALSESPKLRAKQGHAKSSKPSTFNAKLLLRILTFSPLHNSKSKIRNPKFQHSRRPAAAFTLVELLAVVGIMGLLAAVAVPALKGLTGSGGRKQALSQVMGALEIARNTAISTGTNAAVIFPDQNFATQPYRYRSMAVISWDATNSTNGTNVMVGSWIVLPQGVVLHDTQINQLPILTNTTALRIPPSTTPANTMNLRAVVFQSDGGIPDEYYKKEIKEDGISFYEGAVVSSFTTTTNTSKQTNNVETIKISRYTGRPQPTLAEPKK
jgi:type II secretory pathway pseudopilin PulG